MNEEYYEESSSVMSRKGESNLFSSFNNVAQWKKIKFKLKGPTTCVHRTVQFKQNGKKNKNKKTTATKKKRYNLRSSVHMKYKATYILQNLSKCKIPTNTLKHLMKEKIAGH